MEMITDLTDFQKRYRLDGRCRLKELRTINKNIDREFVVNRPSLLLPYLDQIFKPLEEGQEHFVVIFLNVRCNIIGYRVLFSGCEHYAPVDLPLLFRNIIMFGARCFIIAHNHPSGNIKPSDEDYDLTVSIVTFAKMLGCDLLDHLIYSPKRTFSFSDAGIMPNSVELPRYNFGLPAEFRRLVDNCN